MTRRRSGIAQLRSLLYGSARFLGDVRAIQTGRPGRRVRNRIVGRAVSRALRGWMR